MGRFIGQTFKLGSLGLMSLFVVTVESSTIEDTPLEDI